jgi:hypothetical protein
MLAQTTNTDPDWCRCVRNILSSNHHECKNGSMKFDGGHGIDTVLLALDSIVDLRLIDMENKDEFTSEDHIA